MPSKPKTLTLTPDQQLMLKQAACSIQQVLGVKSEPMPDDEYEPYEEGDDEDEDEDDKPRNVTYEMDSKERAKVKKDAKEAGMTHDKMGVLVKKPEPKK